MESDCGGPLRQGGGVQEGLPEEVAFEKKPKWGEAARLGQITEKVFPAK